MPSGQLGGKQDAVCAQAPAQLSRVHETPTMPVMRGDGMGAHQACGERPRRAPESIRRDGSRQGMSAGSPLHLHAGQLTGEMPSHYSAAAAVTAHFTCPAVSLTCPQ